MVLKIKKLKLVNKANVRDAVIYMMQYRINNWWVPRQMQACMWAIGAKMSEKEIEEILEDIFQESVDTTLIEIQRRLFPYARYRCTAFKPDKTNS